MNDRLGAACDRDTEVENLAAELTTAIYPIALGHGMVGLWIQVELGLWRGLAETVKKWGRERPRSATSDELEIWRERFVVNLTESAFGIAVKYGIKGSRLDVELGLYRALRLVVGRHLLRRQVTKGRRS